ncbi:phosphatase PAP2 family protein [Brevibacillus ruminantium]|uniref:Phosphatase PAP2 family protein n=1 Tax=Brevibacillus ruminantium TaxID=2950604 RepID=A0ABY4W9W1_9BACL|nr:phosphatase PAP2 family protein [Brevibacillus ruminantium]USG63714.1 phosphatase PAP2 family protein [Brevibacillus ruminantium]
MYRMTRTQGNRKFLWIAAIFFLLAFGMVAVYKWVGFSGLDEAGFAFASSLRFDLLTTGLTVLTHLGDTKSVITLVAILLLWLFLKGYRKEIVIVAVIILADTMMNELMKNLFARERPIGLNLITKPDSYSFPSGHAMISSVYFLIVAYLFRTLGEHTWWRFLTPLFYVLILLIVSSRVYLGVHFASDVLTGLFFAFGWYFLFRYADDKWVRRRQTSYPRWTPSTRY